jgi:hypothetical protein
MSFETIVKDVADERARQDSKWGRQSHPNGTSPRFRAMADSARNACRKAEENGQASWMAIAREEFWEAAAETDRDLLRGELIQLIAVGVAWVENLDEG